MVGLGWTPEKIAHLPPEIFSNDLKASVEISPGSVTIRGRCSPSAARCSGNSRKAPAPNRTLVGKEKFEIMPVEKAIPAAWGNKQNNPRHADGRGMLATKERTDHKSGTNIFSGFWFRVSQEF